MSKIEYLQDYGRQANEMGIDLMDLAATQREIDQAQNLFQGNDPLKLVKAFLDEDVPDEIKATDFYIRFWAVVGKTIKLTFIEKEDVWDYEALFELCRLTYLMEKPPYKYTFDELQLMRQMKIYYVSAVRRAIGTPAHRFNERIVIGSQTNQIIRSNTEAFSGGSSGGSGFLGKIKNMF